MKLFYRVLILASIATIATLASLSVSNLYSFGIKEVGLKPQNSWVGHYLSGYHATKARDYEQASGFFSKSVQALEQDNYLKSRTVTLLLISGKYREAIELSKQISDSEDSQIANFLLLTSAASDSDYAKAEEYLALIGKQNQNNPINQILLAWIKLGANKKVEAQTTIKALADSGDLQGLTEYHYALISELSGNLPKAAEMYKQILSAESINPGEAIAAYRFYDKTKNEGGKKLARSKLESEEQIDSYIAVQNAKQGIAETYISIAKILMSDYHNDRAASFLRLALYLNPELDEAKLILGSLLINDGDFRSANNVLRQITPDSPLGDFAKLAIAKNFEQMNQDFKARQYLESLLTSKTAKIEALVSLGDIKRKNEFFEEAIDYYTKALDEAESRLKPNQKLDKKYWAIYFARGVCYERIKKWNLSEKDLKQALEFYPNQPDVLNYLAYTWVDMGTNLSKARDMLAEAFRQRPDDAHIIDSLGWALFKLGEYEQALEHLERSIQEMPYDPTVNDHLGDTYWKLGREQEAYFQWQRALDNNPPTNIVDNLKRKLEHGLGEFAKAE